MCNYNGTLEAYFLALGEFNVSKTFSEILGNHKIRNGRQKALKLQKLIQLDVCGPSRKLYINLEPSLLGKAPETW